MERMESPESKPRHKAIGAVCTGLLLIAAALIMLFGYNRFAFFIELAGEPELLLDYGTPYLEYGAEPFLRGSRFWTSGNTPDTEIRITGEVDTSRIGTYTVTYSAEYLWWHAEAVRTVRVVDRKPPEIVLYGGREVYVLPGARYAEPGFTARDEYDGDLSAYVQCEEEDGVIRYYVTDSSGNSTELTRLVHYDDSVLPEITLLGGGDFQIYAGTVYEEPGYTASDNADGDITHLVTMEGIVDRYRTGTYPLTYTVTDSYENVATVVRNVTVLPHERPEQITPEGKVIYLTFDDGPGPYTRKLLDVLAKYDVKATFFVVDNNYAYLISDIVEEGHSVAIHSASHNYRQIYAGVEAYFADLHRVEELIYEQSGVMTTLVRFPGGSSNKVSCFNQGIMTELTTIVQDAGYQYFDWNVDSNDAGGAKTADEVYENVIKGVRNRKVSIVLQHDIKSYSVDAVERIIIWGLKNGYTFLPLEPTSPDAHHNVNN